MACMEEQEFCGLILPTGVERKVLYHSAYRAIATYANSVSDLDKELQALLSERKATIKDDGRRNCCGKCALTADAHIHLTAHAAVPDSEPRECYPCCRS